MKCYTGIAPLILVIIVAALLIGGGTYFTISRTMQPKSAPSEDAALEREGMSEEERAMMRDADDAMMAKKDEGATMPVQGGSGPGGDMKSEMTVTFSGVVLAGNVAPLLDFNKADYDTALASDKLVALYFYANWCPICRAEFPKMQNAFDQLQDDNVVGFRVSYNDNETDDSEKDLAREFGVSYQHTKVFLKNGERVLKSPETWEENRYLNEIAKYTN